MHVKEQNEDNDEVQRQESNDNYENDFDDQEDQPRIEDVPYNNDQRQSAEKKSKSSGSAVK